MSWLLLAGLILSLGKILSAEEKKAAPEKPAKAEAKAKAETAKAKEKNEDKASAGKEEAQAAPDGSPHAAQKEGLFPEKEYYTRAEVEALRQVLDKKTTQLDQDIDAQVKYMESLKTQTEDHLKKIEGARNEIADFMNTRDEKEEGKLKKLAKFYEAMDAEQASPLLKEVPDDLAIKIFDRMDTKKVGAIMALLPATRAARLTQQFPRLKLQMQAEAAR